MDELICRCCGHDIHDEPVLFNGSLYHGCCRAAILAEREACARVAGARADNALRIAHRWTPGHDGNDRTIAHWEARNREALDIAADIRARAASATGAKED